MKNTSNPQTLRDFDEHRAVFDIDHPTGRNLRGFKRNTEDVRVRLSQLNVAGGDKRIYKLIQLKLSNAILIQTAPFVADDNDFQSITCLKSADQIDHFGI